VLDNGDGLDAGEVVSVKRAIWNAKSEPIAAVLPDFRRFRHGFVRELEWVMEAFFADSSSFSANRVTIEAFVLPRFIPTEDLYLTHGFRIRDFWDEIGPDTAAEILAARPALDQLATFAGLRASADRWRTDPNQMELRLCLDVLERNKRDFRKVARRVASADSEGSPWQEAVLQRCRDLVRVVTDGGWEAGEAVLRSRREAVGRLFT
jgi:hypothetical protein